MRQLFRSRSIITQPFGSDHTLTINGKTMTAAQYYGPYGLKGHEGLDVVPSGTVRDTLCVADGIVVKDDDIAGDPRQDAYGISVTVWFPTLRKAAQYCHLKENYVSLGDKVVLGQKLGLMGGTGNVSGDHLHFNLFETDENGIRLNKDNGFLGGIDPMPFLEEEPTVVVGDFVQVDRPKFNDLERCKDIYNKIRAKLDVEDSETVVLSNIDKFIKYEEVIRTQEKTINDLKAKSEELEKKLTALDVAHEAMRVENAKAIQDAKESKEGLDKLKDELQKAKTDLLDIIAISKHKPLSGFRKLLHDISIA